ncbi:hypothetical protein [Methylobacterium durans]|nr:hypothetical protein [Methylobacterium durans]
MLKIVLKTMSVSDRVIASSMMTGLAILMVEYSRTMALPAHFV